jgi:osmotically-inducible protein OsmY
MTPMRRAGRKHVSSTEPKSLTPSGHSRASGVATWRETVSVVSAEDEPIAEMLLSPAGTFTAAAATQSHERSERNRQLAIAIRQRIESRLSGRVRELSITILDRTVVLEGQCSTYYTKQLAQHAALAILEDEQLENAIEVSVPQ